MVLLAMTEVTVSVCTNARVVIYLRPKPKIQFRHGLRVANGVHHVESGHSFSMLIANFTKKSPSPPRKTGVAYAAEKTFALLIPDEKTARSAIAALHIPSTPSAAKANGAD